MNNFRIGVDASFWIDDNYTLSNLIRAEKSGFDIVWLGDHFLPWHHSFKHSCYVWSVLPVALERTKRIIVGVDVTVPLGARYHPAIIAQASGTIGKMYPHRFYLGLGSGEAMSEERFLGHWPRWLERIDRLNEAVELIDKLLSSKDFFDFGGKYFPMNMVYLYVKPEERIPIYYFALGPKSAYHAGRSGKNLMTLATISKWNEEIYPSFRRGAQDAGINTTNLDKSLMIPGAIGHVKEAAENARKLFAGSIIPEMFNEPDPRKIEDAARRLTDEQIHSSFSLVETVDQMVEKFDQYRNAGITNIIYLDVGPDPEETMELFSKKIIPYFKGK